jgi:hypothetical protein
MRDQVNESIFYVFVNFNGDKLSEPDYFIATGFEAKGKVKQYTTWGIFDLSTFNRQDFKNRWDKIALF